MRSAITIRSLLFSFVLLAFSHGAFAQVGIGISVGFGPPAASRLRAADLSRRRLPMDAWLLGL